MDYTGEERQGFYIRPMMKRWWAVSLDIVKEIGDICAKYNIRWFIDSGTLLGAVREHGFIPWDDDMDIILLRQDYERFIRIIPNELPEGWVLKNTRHDDEHGEAVLRVCNTDNNFIDMNELSRYHGCPYQVGIDIFALDNVPDDPDECELQRALATIIVDSIKAARSSDLFDDLEPGIAERLAELEEAFGIKLKRDMPIKPQLFALLDQTSAMYYDVDTKRVANMMFFCTDPKQAVSRQAYDSTVYLKFEHLSLPAPSGYDDVLTSYYGNDYMTPVNEHIYHDYPCFGKLEAYLKQQYEERGLEFPQEFAE
ncbi:MAG: LicD family protein [Lachnospiraceae bacterium]|nr:LicD family protein [Lachnospiraceae bacterium]